MRDGVFEGRTSWDSVDTQKIERTIISQSGMKLTIEFLNEEGRYTASLQRTDVDDTYRGQFILRSGKNTSTGKVSCKLFNYDDDIVLFGRWIEDNIPYYWWAELYEVE
ncbi:hypothetical protein [Thiothrix lacustris]|uniref:hypothetical protein n=1 Tax=Thiothrix lacustris TaxID=525917 RepID=UPI000490274D|nr:hypothetical protein [Thiothrix lacustris]